MDAKRGDDSHHHMMDPPGLQCALRQISLSIVSGRVFHRDMYGLPASEDDVSQTGMADILGCIANGCPCGISGLAFCICHFCIAVALSETCHPHLYVRYCKHSRNRLAVLLVIISRCSQLIILGLDATSQGHIRICNLAALPIQLHHCLPVHV
jgi:hypothetical protein